jgi:hypothetical protein
MDESADGVGRYKAECPENEEYNGNGDKHGA